MCHGGRVIRLLGLVGGLSVALDMGVGAPLEESLRRCLVGVRLARAAGCDEGETGWVMYASLLQHLGCTAASHELAAVFGDDVAATRWAFRADPVDPRSLWGAFAPGVAAATGRSRAGVVVAAITRGRRIDATAPVATCEVARGAATRLGLPEAVRDALYHATARWDGRGFPPVAGAEIPRTTRLMHVASVAVLFQLVAGTAEALAELRRRAGAELDPGLVAAFSPELLDGIEELDAFEAVLRAEPGTGLLIGERDRVEVARTFGDLVDLKSPWLHGHAAGVAGLAEPAAARLGLDAEALALAGYLHDVGRVGVASAIWDKATRLSTSERAQVELHAYHSEKVLSRVPQLAAVATLAGQHHERLDGSGYHRGTRGAQLTMPSRVLAASDRYRTLVEARPHRPALPPGAAAQALRDDARAGRLDADAVSAVLDSAGHGAGARHAHVAGLTDRQVQILRLMAAGMSNSGIAERLVISRRTAEHHVQDVYARIGCTSRAAAALFAMEHGLIGPGDG